ncbi:MAG TPA: hypothetical protein IAC74_07785 [Candidatus Aphodoplasma excrementigallinarum]|uniref:Sialate O-acetylesterase domain-containing protein n=1 Tax=Candidatus Aphodoplasma excrementigallinarum TaxID=2840673 RepID=A0A9D1T186_9FIRM|nr:hypothetical protein [Candidatus Aphodoplasma excrementigallinarum]
MAQTVEQDVFDPVLNGDMSTVGTISITPNITSGDVYFEAKVMFTGTDYVANLFRVRHYNSSTTKYDNYTPTILEFQGGKIYTRHGYEDVTEVANASYAANQWYTFKVLVKFGGQWGPAFDVWMDDGSGEKQIVWNRVVTGGVNFTNLGRVDFSAEQSTPFEYIKCYRLVEEGAPAVFLESPLPNQSFVVGEDIIPLSASASYGAGVEKVEFYTGDTLIKTVTGEPYTYHWADAAVGTHIITAKAYGTDGSFAVSSPVTISVEEPNARPVVEITAPANYTLFAPGEPVTITAEAADPDGTIQKVDFYQGMAKLENGTLTQDGSTYSYTFTPENTGSSVITAVATDDRGKTGAGPSLQIEVGSSPLVEETFYSYDFNDYTAVDQTTGPKNKFNAWATSGGGVAPDGLMSGVAAPDKPEWGNCIRLDSGFGAQLALPVPNPTSGIIAAEGDFRFTGTDVSRTLLHPRYTSSASTIAQVFSTSGNNFITKDSSFNELQTGYKFTENEWYHIKVLVNLNNATYAVEVDGETVVRMALISYWDRFNAVNLFGLGQTNGDGSVYIDNLKISRRAAPSVTASISEPYSGKIVQAGTDVTITSLASTTDGSIEKVEYYNGSTFLGESATSPYTFVWEDVPAGEHRLTAKAYSSTGVAGTSNVTTLVSRAVVLPSIFGSDMVLQQNMPIKVWGTGIDGDTVTVSFNGEEKSAPVSGGEWAVELSPLAADNKTQYTMSVESALHGSVSTFTNIMMGEVWVCSGQSNMERTMYSDGEAAVEMPKANYPNIRLFSQSANPSAAEQIDVKNGGWAVCSPNTVGSFSAVGYYFGREIHLSQDVPVGLISATVGGTQVASWVSKEALSANSALASYKNSTASQTGNRIQNGLYNGMIAPLMPLSVKGVIWYQGESDVYYGNLYTELLSTLITSWRSEWGNEDLEFHVVQLPNYNDTNASARYDLVRASQFEVSQTLDKVGLAITLDVGDSNDVHPLYKQPVGKRLALSARYLTYGEDIEVYQGPVFKSMEKGDGTLSIDFYHTGTELKTDDGQAPACFEVSGTDGVFYPAEAVIQDGKIVVSSPGVADPVSVRYAYGNDPHVNLYNSADLPAAPFLETYAPVQEGVTAVSEGVVYRDAQGAETAEITAGGTVEVTVTVTNHTEELADAVVVLALSEDGRLVGSGMKQKERISAGGSREITLSLAVPDNAENLTASAFAWDSLFTMRPLSSVIQ